MAWFQTKPNLPHDQKARIEFFAQSIVDGIGVDCLKRPVVTAVEFEDLVYSNSSLDDLVGFVSKQLGFDPQGLQFQTRPQQLETCGGGG